MILDVIVHDPLFGWMRSIPQLLRRQDARRDSRANNVTGAGGDIPTQATDIAGENTSAGADRDDAREIGEKPALKEGTGEESLEEVEKDASRVLLRMRQKLRGQEDVGAEALGVEGQVDKLINAAMDERNLCTLYAGWGAWM